ncbi:MAG: SDR family NAD(P)-dependent oxidoreductase [Actinomycetaceae bacterium]|nr:SDR family NAD(P)-dependent oxidoreductase [Actinomycetaceae bacterium]
MIDIVELAPLLRGALITATGSPVIVRLEDSPADCSITSEGVPCEAALEIDAADLATGAVNDQLKGLPTLPVCLRVKDGAELLLFSVRALPTGDRPVKGRVALVTGGAQGFGEELVRGLVKAGAFVYIADLNIDGAAALSTELNSELGADITHPLKVDVSNEDSVAALCAQVATVTGGLDVLVSNAGVLRSESVLTQSSKDFRFVTEVNYTAFFLVVKQVAALLAAQHRTAPTWMTDIVQINSKSGLEGSNKNAAYAGSKFGSLGLVQSFALELVEYGVKVNAICPGNFFEGPLWSDPDNGLFVQYLRAGKVPGATSIADVKAFYEAKVPMGRGAQGEDVLRALNYLVEQCYETGQALPVTGGQVMLN